MAQALKRKVTEEIFAHLNMAPFRVLFLGAPGVGKGTYAKIIAPRMNLAHLSPGYVSFGFVFFFSISSQQSALSWSRLVCRWKVQPQSTVLIVGGGSCNGPDEQFYRYGSAPVAVGMPLESAASKRKCLVR